MGIDRLVSQRKGVKETHHITSSVTESAEKPPRKLGSNNISGGLFLTYIANAIDSPGAS